jgi:hypothetical protein
MKLMKVKSKRLINFNRNSDIIKAERIRKLIEEVINDDGFRNEILKADFKDRTYIDEKGKTIEINNNEDILDKIISGKEQYTGEAEDFEWDLRITL